MSEQINSGFRINFAEYCPYLKEHDSGNPTGLFFTPDTAIASETHCSHEGLPGVEKRSDSGFLVPINPDRIVVYCSGCSKLAGGFEQELKNIS